MTAFESVKPSLFYRPYMLLIAIAFLLVSVYIFFNAFLPIKHDQERDKSPKLWMLVPLLFSVIPFLISVFVCVSFFSTNMDYINIYEQYACGQSEVVEGMVEEFHPMPETLHDSEHFEVAGVKFNYGADNSKCFYSRCKKDGGIFVGNGQKVKIWYVPYDGHNYIMRVDLLDS